MLKQLMGVAVLGVGMTFLSGCGDITVKDVTSVIDKVDQEISKNKGAVETGEGTTVKSLSEFKIPAYDGRNDVIKINGGRPFFTSNDLKASRGYEKYSNLDKLGRSGSAMALITRDIMPTGERESLTYEPTGWEQLSVPTKNGKKGTLYDRCHIVGYQLAGENNNPKNLFTCTRKANRINMLVYENEIASYVKRGGKVLLRATPMYSGNDLLAKGILYEVKSVDTDAIQYNVFIHNVEDGVGIDYSTGSAYIK